MPIFGLDVSHHNPMLDWARCRREGVEFAILKSTEGSTFIDPEFVANLSAVRAAGVASAAYHYVRANASVAAQVENVKRVVPRDVPVIPDVEANSGGVTHVRGFIDRLREAGYRVPLLYLPRWYWSQIGQPPLTGLPPLWSSRYPDNTQGTIAEEYADVPTSYWGGYGGLPVAVLQFSSSGRVAGHAPLDLNAYPGTRAGLEALFYGTQPGPGPVEIVMEEDEVAKYCLVKGDNTDPMPAPHQGSKYGDATFLVEATVDGLKRRHVSADEYHALVGAGMKVTEHRQAWVDSISNPGGMFPWENTEEEPG